MRPWQSRSTRSDNRKASGEYGSVTQRGVEDAAPYHRARQNIKFIMCNKTKLQQDDASIVPYKWFASFVAISKVSPRQDEGIPPYSTFIGRQHIIKCSVGNGLPSDNPIESMLVRGVGGRRPDCVAGASHFSIETRQGPGGLR